MISHRLRGLVNLHSAVATLTAALVLLTYASCLHFLPIITLNYEISLTSYLFCVIGGMVLSSRHLYVYASRFHRLAWVDAAQISTRQIVSMALLIFALMFALKDRSVSRLFLGSYLGLCWVILLFVNHAMPRMLSRLVFQRQHKVPTLFIGTGAQLAKLRDWLATKEVLGIQPVGFLSEDVSAGLMPGQFPFLGSLADLSRIIEDKLVAQVIVLELPTTTSEGRYIIETCQDRGCRVLLYNNLSEQLKHPLIPVSEEGHHFYTLQEEPLEDPLNRMLKRSFDIFVSLFVVVLLVPPLSLWVWLIQRLQAPGSLFFVQPRSGQRRGRFHMLKFRSMYEATSGTGAESQQAQKGDDRIYPFGGFLRRTSLDEFPQFINVLRGDMSIVGPRPHMPVHDDMFGRLMSGYRTRFFVKPGITGLAQVRGFRGEISDPQLLRSRVQWDLQYITSWSIWLDLQITLKTLWHVLFPPKTAY